MDSHSFRVAGTELLALLAGARVEKIHAPCPGTLACTLFAGEKKRILLLRHGRQAPLLFFTEERPANPLRPPALVMRLRKYCAGRRLGEGRMDYAARVLAFPVLVPPREPARWLLLDMARGAAVHEELPPAFGAVPAWPDAELTDSLCAVPWRKGEKDGPWRDYPVLTPLLRETLAALDPMEGRALLMDLEAGGGELFFYADAENKPALYAAWPLPARVLARRELFPRPLPESAKSAVPGYPALATVSLVDGSKFFADPGLSGRKKEELPERRAAKKRNRLLAAWDRERERLSAMLALREDALRIQRELWLYPPEAKLDELRM